MKDKLSFKEGHRGRTLFTIGNYIFFVIIMVLMLIPIFKVIVDSVDPTTTYGIRLLPKKLA